MSSGTYMATPILRWKRLFLNGDRPSPYDRSFRAERAWKKSIEELQQKWINMETGEEEWRAIDYE